MKRTKPKMIWPNRPPSHYIFGDTNFKTVLIATENLKLKNYKLAKTIIKRLFRHFSIIPSVS